MELSCVSQFVGIDEDWSKLDRTLEALMAAGIPRHLFKILTSNDDIDLKPVTQYLKAVLSSLGRIAIVPFRQCDRPYFPKVHSFFQNNKKGDRPSLIYRTFKNLTDNSVPVANQSIEFVLNIFQPAQFTCPLTIR